MGQNKQNSIKVLDVFDITMTQSMNFSSLLEEKCASIRQTYISKQLSQMFTQSAVELLTQEAHSAPALTLSALSESLAALTQGVAEKSPSWPSLTFGPADGTLYGMPYYLSAHLTEPVPDGDWSLCRSPSRARRRHKQGHRQHVVWVRPARHCYVFDGRLYMHPAVGACIRNEFERMGNYTC